MLALLEHTPDLYLDEIQEKLSDMHDLTLSLTTIARTLKRMGIGSKKVCHMATFKYLLIEACPIAIQGSCRAF